MPNLRIFHHHAKSIGYCNRGMRAAAERWNLDWHDFKTNGIDADTLRQVDDAMALSLVQFVESLEVDDSNGKTGR